MKKPKFQPCERLVSGKLANCLRPRFLLASILLVITMSTVSEADCWDDSLNQVNKGILRMASGAVYQVVPRDAMNSVFWLPLTSATVCDSIVDVGGELSACEKRGNRRVNALALASEPSSNLAVRPALHTRRPPSEAERKFCFRQVR